LRGESAEVHRNTAIASAKKLRNYYRHWLWLLRGGGIPISHIAKRNRILRVAKFFNCQSLIETGTFYGEMIESVLNQFTMILSVELSTDLFTRNIERFADSKNVLLFQGNSSVMLPAMIGRSEGRVLFWLDAHYSGLGTARGAVDCPIWAELDAIASHPRNDHCILIDDARCFDGTRGYPKVDEVKARLLQINPKYLVTVEQDCIVVVPPRLKAAS
jgi:hypothetical protein